MSNSEALHAGQPRRIALAVACGLVGVTLAAGCGIGPGAAGPTGVSSGAATQASPSTAEASKAETPKPTSGSDDVAVCGGNAAKLDLEQKIGQLLMVGIASDGLSPSTADVLDATKAGSVILLGNSEAGSEMIKALTDDARQAAGTSATIKPMLVADQEGGQVQRLRGEGFDPMPTAVDQGQMKDATLKADAATWGQQLRDAGIDANLAPVADVVPEDQQRSNAPIGQLQRGFSSDVDVVAKKVPAFVAGMDKAGLATAVKHFPGLGKVRGNTDFSADVHDTVTTRDDPDLGGFEAGVKGGVDMVMVSSAYYDKIDSKNIAAFSTKIISGMVRDDLGFGGVIVSDDMSAQALASLKPGTRAERFIRAGGDLIIVGDPSEAEAMADALVAQAESDPKFASRIDQSVARILAMKDRRGLC